MSWEHGTVEIKPQGWLGGKIDTAEPDDTLDRMGSQGWELVCRISANTMVEGATREVVLVFKRPGG